VGHPARRQEFSQVGLGTEGQPTIASLHHEHGALSVPRQRRTGAVHCSEQLTGTRGELIVAGLKRCGQFANHRADVRQGRQRPRMDRGPHARGHLLE
ncbi:MAG: hypothetical protein ACK55I_38760, partial [bacterium]